MAAILGARKVMVTDYPDADLIDNLAKNIATCSLLPQPASTAVAEGYLWGSPTKKILAHLPPPSQGFDILLLADLLFNHSCHDALVSTILQTLARTSDARALVFFTPYRPWLLEKDMEFFNVCRDKALEVIRSSEFSLAPTFMGVWGRANKNNPEMIWELQTQDNDTYGTLLQYYYSAPWYGVTS